MIHINKPNTVPTVLNNNVTNKNFNKNIANKKFAGTDRYTKVKKELSELYNNKCAYCESDITVGAPNHIEHYRPKSIYYWLTYSWDNLLLSCPNCNVKKKDKFDIRNNKKKYNNEALKDLHNKIIDYDIFENPLLLNPEKLSNSEFAKHFSFNAKGKLIAKSDEMKYTIEICDLNREKLIKKRISILNTYRAYLLLSSYKIEQTELFIKILDSSIKNNEEYIAWRSFLKEELSKALN